MAQLIATVASCVFFHIFTLVRFEREETECVYVIFCFLAAAAVAVVVIVVVVVFAVVIVLLSVNCYNYRAL